MDVGGTIGVVLIVLAVLVFVGGFVAGFWLLRHGGKDYGTDSRIDPPM